MPITTLLPPPSPVLRRSIHMGHCTFWLVSVWWWCWWFMLFCIIISLQW